MAGWIRKLVLFAMLFTIGLTPAAARQIELKGAGAYTDILAFSEICLNASIDPASLQDCRWTETHWAHQSFAYRKDPVWIKLTIRNGSAEPVWYLISEYAWIDHVDLFEDLGGELLLIERNGDAVPVDQTSVVFKQPVFPLTLGQKPRTFLLRIHGESELLIGLALEDRLTFAARPFSIRDLFLAAAALCVFAVLANLLLWRRVKSDIPAYYGLFAVASLGYMAFLDGSLVRQLLHTTAFRSDQIQYGLGLFVTGTMLLVWTKIIPMKELFPRLRRFTSLYAYFIFAAAVLAAAGFVSLVVVEILVRMVLVYSNISFFPTALIAYRKGFRPAIYPVFGLPVFGALILIYLLSGLAFSGSLWLKNSIWISYIFEYSLFFASMMSRIRFEASGEMQEFRESVRRTSRLGGVDAEDLKRKIQQLMGEEVYCDETLTLKSLAERLDIRPDQLSEFINVTYGVGFRRWLNQKRVQRAGELLLEDREATILKVALDTGFGTKAAFNREFKSQTGMTPTEFRSHSAPSSDSGTSKG